MVLEWLEEANENQAMQQFDHCYCTRYLRLILQKFWLRFFLVMDIVSITLPKYGYSLFFFSQIRSWETRLQKFRDLRMEQKTGRLNRLPKGDAARLKRQLAHLQTYLGGIKYMTGLPDIVIIVDQQEDYTALRECITLGIPTICLIDTNCDPDLADISIPANDDTIASIRLILNKLVFAICEGRSSYIRNP
eukprot:XP_002514491.2 uncharacterized protein LOC8264507 [Ricinus communis]